MAMASDKGFEDPDDATKKALERALRASNQEELDAQIEELERALRASNQEDHHDGDVELRVPSAARTETAKVPGRGNDAQELGDGGKFLGVDSWTRISVSGANEDRSTNNGTPMAWATPTTRSFNQQPIHQWQQRPPFLLQPPFLPNNFWQAGPPPAGFHPMEGENNMESHGPNGPTYDNMMYDGNNQRNGYMHHGNDERMSETSWQANHHRGKRPDKRPDKRLSQFFRYNSRSKVFVGGLCSRTTDESLRAAFEHCGNVINASVLVDSQTRRSRGFGYVTFMGEVPDGVSDRYHEV